MTETVANGRAEDSQQAAYVPAAQLQQLQQGDQAAFASLVKAHHRALVALVTPMVGASNAEEVVQNGWIKAYRAIADFEGRARLRTWLSRIVINEAKMWLRKHRRDLLMADLPGEDRSQVLEARFSEAGSWSQPPGSWHTDSPDGILMGQQLGDCLQRLLADLPGKQRALLEMRDVANMEFEEICNVLDVSASNARVLLHRARGRLYALVDHYQETGEC